MCLFQIFEIKRIIENQKYKLKFDHLCGLMVHVDCIFIMLFDCIRYNAWICWKYLCIDIVL